MSSFQESWSFRSEELAWNGYVGVVTTPIYSSTSESDECDGDLLSLFEQPEPSYCMRKERVDRGGRPFPYTRSKTRWRKRPSDEIKYLNEQVDELEKVKTQLSMINATPDALVGDQPKALKKLREKSSNEKLDAALAENRKLHAMVTARFQVTKALQAAIDEDVRQRAKAVVNEFDFALLGEEREYQHPALSKILV